MTTRILHLSDLHFGSDHHFDQSGNDPTSFALGDSIADVLSQAAIGHLDAIVITGDLFSKDQPRDLAFAKPGLRKLLDSLGVAAERVYVVPGNRDLSWDEAFKKSPFQFYDELIESLSLSAAKRNQLPRVVSLNGGPDVDLILLDSCQLESPEMAGYGRIGDPQLRALRAQPKSSPDAVRIAALHHHLLPVWGIVPIWNREAPREKPIDKVSLTLDAPNVLRELAACGVSVVLHGHQHKPFIVRHENYQEKPYSMVVIGAGSAGAEPEGDASTRRQFFLHEVEPDTIRCQSFVQSDDNPSTFKPLEHTTVALIPPAGHACVVDLRANRIRKASKPAAAATNGDSSDLFYLFLSVVNCVEALKVVRQLEGSWWTEAGKPERANPELAITDVYDLMGRWDLLVRFRTPRSADAREFARKLRTRLQGDHDQQEYNLQHYESHEFLDIVEEFGSLSREEPQNSIPSWRTRLGSTEKYETSRCQRALIVIPCGSSDARERLVRDLRLHGKLRAFEGHDGIIESYSIAQHDIVLEIFLTCSKGVLLNKLNRELEECLRPHRIQKYTLLCYGYHEQLAANQPSRALAV